MKNMEFKTAEEAVQVVKSGNRVFLQGSAATPVLLIEALQQRHEELRDVELVSITTMGELDFNNPTYRNSFYFNSLFVSANTRDVVNSERGEYVPIFLSQIPQLFTKNILPLDVAFIQVSSPDKHGYCSLGVSVDIARAAVDTARHIVALVNPQMPRTHGDGFVHVSKINSFVFCDTALPEMDYASKSNSIVQKIGVNVASMIEDGSTLQLGIGSIPDQILHNLGHLKNLGLHTEMFSDGVIPLIESGVIDNVKYRCH